MTVWSELNHLSDEAFGRRIVRVIGLAGAGLCLVPVLFDDHGGGKFIAGLFTAGFLLTALLPRSFGPRFGQGLVGLAVVIAFMGAGGGIKEGVSPLVWLAIVPVVLFSMLLAYPGGAVWIVRSMIGVGR